MSFSTYATLYVYCTIFVMSATKKLGFEHDFFYKCDNLLFFCGNLSWEDQKDRQVWASGLEQSGRQTQCMRPAKDRIQFKMLEFISNILWLDIESKFGQFAQWSCSRGKSQSHSGVTRTAKESFNF